MVAERVVRGFWPFWVVVALVLAPLLMGWQDLLPVEGAGRTGDVTGLLSDRRCNGAPGSRRWRLPWVFPCCFQVPLFFVVVRSNRGPAACRPELPPGKGIPEVRF